MTKTNQILHCSSCNASVEAACDCGVPYITAAEAAKRAVKKNPDKSSRAIADEIGVSRKTVDRARQDATGTNGPVEKRVGLDGKARKMPKAPRLDRARAAVREQVRANAPVNARKIAGEIGVSHVTVETAVAAERAFVEGAQEAAALDLAQHSPAARERIERTLATYRQKLEAEFNSRVSREVNKQITEWWDGVLRTTIRREIDELMEALDTRRGLMTEKEYKLVERCLHPDNSASHEKRAAAFDFWRLTKTKIRMLDATQFTAPLPEVPATRAGWDALKRKVAEKKASEKAARKAANAVAKDLN